MTTILTFPVSQAIEPHRRKTLSQIKRDQERLTAHKQKESRTVAATDQCLQTPAHDANKVNNNIATDVPVINDCFRVTRSKSGVLPIEQTRTLSTSSNVTEYDASVLSMDNTVPLDLSLSLVQDHERSPDTPFLKHIEVESSPLLTVSGLNTLNTDPVASNCDSGPEVESVISSKGKNLNEQRSTWINQILKNLQYRRYVQSGMTICWLTWKGTSQYFSLTKQERSVAWYTMTPA